MPVIIPATHNTHKAFTDSILSYSKKIPGFNQLRSKGEKGLEVTAFPTLRGEYWKYTRVSGLLNTEFKVKPLVQASISKATLAIIGDQPRLVFVNGFLHPDLTELPKQKGLHVSVFSSDKITEDQINHFPTSWENEQEAFTLLNEASFTDGLCITVDKNTEIASPVFIIHIQNGEHTATANRHYYALQTGAKATFISLFEGDESPSLSNHFSSYLVAENADLHAFDYHQNGDKSQSISTAIVHQQANSKVNLGAYVFKGKLTRKNFYISVLGSNSDAIVNGTYILGKKEIADFRVIIDHKAPHCTSNQTFKGVLNDKSSGVFNGKIYVRKDAQVINAFQTNRNVLLSDDAQAFSRPQLEIYADDVKCSHGSTIGQLDSDALFYLMARGIKRLEAEKLLVSAFVSDAINNVGDESFHHILSDAIAIKSSKF